MLPSTLYHGSAFWTKELKPGFKHTGIEVRWDQTESNHFLYATTDREQAIVLGFASAVEKKFGLDHFQSVGKTILLDVPRQPHGYTVKEEQLYQLEVWLYTIVPTARDGWALNRNAHNQLTNEYKTQNTVRGIRGVEKIDVREWLKQYELTI